MNTERLGTLRDALLDQSEMGKYITSFDMNLFFNHNSYTCETAACALGLAASLPKLKALGLELVEHDDDINLPDCEDFVVYYGEFLGYSAASEFFDISDGMAHYLFNPMKYSYGPIDDGIPPRRVADRITSILSGEATCT